MIRLFSPFVPKDVYEEVKKTLSSTHLTQGSKVEEFERNFKELFDIEYPVSVNSGTSALELAYELIGIKPGDEVITTPLTCTATNIPLLRLGAKIVWADIEEDTLCIDPTDVFRKVTERTKAIVQVHLGGVMSMVTHLSSSTGDKLNQYIPIVSDACQALGIFTGDYTCCSFQAIKHITTGDGGMLVVSNNVDYKKAKLMRWFGIDRERPIVDDWKSYKTRMMSFDIEVLGTKRHMNDIDATMGIVGLTYYNYVLHYRKNLFNIYREKLRNIKGIKLIDGGLNTYWLVTVLVERRDDFAKLLYEHGIETNIVQVRNDQYSIFGGKKANLPIMDKIEGKYISIPIGTHVTVDNAEYICKTIRGGW